MTAYTLTKHTNIRQLTVAGGYSARTGGDTIANTNGFNLTIDQDTRFGLGSPVDAATTSGSLGSITITASLGGDILIDGTKVWLIPFTGGSGTLVPTLAGVTISGATCNTIGVYTSLTSAPVSTGATGWLKVTNVSGSLPSTGTFTSDGFTYTISSAPVRGWIEIVGDDASTANCNRLGNFNITGAWYEIGVTSGNRTSVYNVPNNGKQLYVPAIWVQGETWTITSASWSNGKCTYITTVDHDMLIGQLVTITGITPSAYNVDDVYITFADSKKIVIDMASDPGAWVSGGSSVSYENWPCAGTYPATAANIIDENTRRGKVFWNTNATTSLALPLGYIRFGSDGTNTTGGYCPPAGRKIRIGNVFLTNCTVAARNQNVLPNAIFATRYDFTTTGAGNVNIDKASICWYLSIAQAKSFSISNSGTFTQISISEVPTEVIIKNFTIGCEAAISGQTCLYINLNYLKTTLNNVVAAKYATTSTGGEACFSVNQSNNVESNDCVGWVLLYRTGNTSVKYNLFTAVSNLLTYRFHCINESLNILSCDNFYCKDTKYTDTTGIRSFSQDGYPIVVGGLPSYGIFDGLSFVGYRAVPQGALFVISGAIRKPVKIRNLGTYNSPMVTGDGPYVNVSWSRTTTVCTVTHVGHNLVTGDIIGVYTSSSLGAIVAGSKAITVLTVDTYTFVCLNAGDATGTLSYYLCNFPGLVSASIYCNDVYLQRIYMSHNRGSLFSPDNSNSNIYLETAISKFDPLIPLSTFAALTSSAKFSSAASYTPNASQYGTNWFNGIYGALPDNVNFTWTRSGTTITATEVSGYHNQVSIINYPLEVLSSSDEIALNSGHYVSYLAPSTAGSLAQTIQFTSYNAGSTSGTAAITSGNVGVIYIFMNEGSSTNYTITAGNPRFTGSGTLSMFNVGDQIIFESPFYLKGHTGFSTYVPILTAGAIRNYNIEYQIDFGSGYSGWKTMFRQTLSATADGTAGSNSIVQVPAADSWIQDGDYVQTTVWGDTHRSAKVSSGGGTTTLTLDRNNNTTFTNRELQVFRLPSENASISASPGGFKLKVKITTVVANVSSLGTLILRTLQDTTSRDVTFPLDVVNVKVTCLDAATFAPIQSARVYLVADAGGWLPEGSVIANDLTDSNGVLSLQIEKAGLTQPVSGRVRKMTDSPMYKNSPIVGIIDSTGLSINVFMVSDE